MSYYRYSKKQEAEDLKKVDVFFLKSRGYFHKGFATGNVTWSRNGDETGRVGFEMRINENEKYLRFIYTQTDRETEEKTDFDYKIPITTTACNLGGVRYWFQCPFYTNGLYCGRRVGALYLGDKYFACRHCYNLTYSSRNVSGISKLLGQLLTERDTEKSKIEVKRKCYRGKMTKKYARYLRKELKSMRQMNFIANGLYKPQ